MADFHALRHTYISRVVSSGASGKVAQELARHSTPTLTIGRYAHARLNDLSAAIEAVSNARPAERQRAVGQLGKIGTNDPPESRSNAPENQRQIH